MQLRSNNGRRWAISRLVLPQKWMAPSWGWKPRRIKGKVELWTLRERAPNGLMRQRHALEDYRAARSWVQYGGIRAGYRRV